MLTKQLEEIEDALGHEVYFFSLKGDRVSVDDPINDRQEEE